jgi:hypothetical protein
MTPDDLRSMAREYHEDMGVDWNVNRLTALLTRVAATARKEMREEAAKFVEGDAVPYDQSADEVPTDRMVPGYQVGRAMAVACRTAARAIRALPIERDK